MDYLPSQSDPAGRKKNKNVNYRIAGKFGGDNVWRIDSCKLFGEEKFGEWLLTKKIIA